MSDLGIPEVVPSDAELLSALRELSQLQVVPWQGMESAPGRPIAGGGWDQRVPEGVCNPYWELIRSFPTEESPLGDRPEPYAYWPHLPEGGMRRAYGLGLGRTALCRRYSWSIPSPGDLAWLVRVLGGRGVVEIGAGTGYWAWQMSQYGVAVDAYDLVPDADRNPYISTVSAYHPVLAGDETAVRGYPGRALFLSWPVLGAGYPARLLSLYRGDLLIYAGEHGGCCADEEFFTRLSAEWEPLSVSGSHVTWWGVHCVLTAYVRRSGASAQAAAGGSGWAGAVRA